MPRAIVEDNSRLFLRVPADDKATLMRVVALAHADPYAYLRDVLERLPTQPDSRIAELLPHRWQAPISTGTSTQDRSSKP